MDDEETRVVCAQGFRTGWVEDIIRLYAARALGGICNNSAQICESGENGKQEPDTRQKGRALAIYVGTKGTDGRRAVEI